MSVTSFLLKLSGWFEWANSVGDLINSCKNHFWAAIKPPVSDSRLRNIAKWGHQSSTCHYTVYVFYSFYELLPPTPDLLTSCCSEMAAAPIEYGGRMLIAMVEDDDEYDDGDDDNGSGRRLMGTRWLASGSSNQRYPPSPLLHSALIRGLGWILTVLMCVCVRACLGVI